MLTGESLGEFSKPIKRGRAFGKFPFLTASRAYFHQIALLLKAVTYVQCVYFWNLGDSVVFYI